MAYRVLMAQFMHETNTFSKLPTTLEDYRKRWLIEGEAIVPRFKGTERDRRLHRRGAQYGWQPVCAVAANATPSGTLTRRPGRRSATRSSSARRKAGKLDGICLSLHGAMVTRPRTMPRARCSSAARRGRARRADRRHARPARQRHGAMAATPTRW
jgi:microcystin degradation protein MlrC